VSLQLLLMHGQQRCLTFRDAGASGIWSSWLSAAELDASGWDRMVTPWPVLQLHQVSAK